MSLILHLQDEVELANTPAVQDFKKWASAAIQNETIQQEVTIRIINQENSAKLNEHFRKRTGPTNVLSFNYPDIPGVKETIILGDLAICADLVIMEASQQGVDIFAHWAHLTIHGLLHLQGYDHINEEDAKQMEQLESEIMIKLGFFDPYQIEYASSEGLTKKGNND